MPGQSPSTTLYTLGRGILQIGEWSGVTPPAYPGGFEDVGNSPRFEVEVAEETLDHFSSRTGLRLKDKTVTLETSYTLSFDLDEVSIENLARYVRGTVAGNVVQAAVALEAEFALRFTTDNPAGENQTWVFHRVRLTPGGTLNLIADEWMLVPFGGEGLADTDNNPNSPFFDVEWATTTTTTVTTTT
jgi:hypothetical protein